MSFSGEQPRAMLALLLLKMNLQLAENLAIKIVKHPVFEVEMQVFENTHVLLFIVKCLVTISWVTSSSLKLCKHYSLPTIRTDGLFKSHFVRGPSVCPSE